MENIKMKDETRYIVGKMDDVPLWLTRDVTDPRHLKFALTENVSIALKAADKNIAKDMLAAYKSDTGDKNDFTILKILVKYEIVDE